MRKTERICPPCCPGAVEGVYDGALDAHYLRYFFGAVLLVVGSSVHVETICGAWQVREAKVTWWRCPGPVCLDSVNVPASGTAEGVNDGTLYARTF